MMAGLVRKYTGADAGFSLVETMVAMLIFASVSAAGVAILISFNSGQQALATADDFIADMQISSSLLRADLEHALPRASRDASSAVLPVFAGGLRGDQLGVREDGIVPLLAFVRGGHMAALVSDTAPAVQRVEYVLKDGALVRRAYARPDATATTPVAERVVMRGVTSAEVRFRSSDTWVMDWYGRAGQPNNMPGVVEVSLEIEGRGTLKRLYAVGAGS
ncbi:type II secretion system minor pseudopilin GspJ [Kordiimonas sp.]|uniref:type II secretion system minor pseudopilin GspJ n=1 Tax=Kordiimonas sp. TaxID=1970157 RepID=UPI003A94ED37